MLYKDIGFMQMVERGKGKFSRGTLSEWLSGKYDPKPTKLMHIAQILGIEIDELFRDPYAGDIIKPKPKEQLVPIVGFADCGNPAETWLQGGNKFFDAGDIKGLHTPFILTARGDSMRPYINPYDKLLCSFIPFERVKDKTAVVVAYKSPPETAEANAKLIIKKDKHCILYSVNTIFPPVEIPYNEIARVYKLVRIIREVK
jgi:transcriptional regulator with XRE-family HTH domain